MIFHVSAERDDAALFLTAAIQDSKGLGAPPGSVSQDKRGAVEDEASLH